VRIDFQPVRCHAATAACPHFGGLLFVRIQCQSARCRDDTAACPGLRKLIFARIQCQPARCHNASAAGDPLARLPSAYSNTTRRHGMHGRARGGLFAISATSVTTMGVGRIHRHELGGVIHRPYFGCSVLALPFMTAPAAHSHRHTTQRLHRFKFSESGPSWSSNATIHASGKQDMHT
jgi:hypothetical protein